MKKKIFHIEIQEITEMRMLKEIKFQDGKVFCNFIIMMCNTHCAYTNLTKVKKTGNIQKSNKLFNYRKLI